MTSILDPPSQSDERSVLFAAASALVNCTNSYDYEEPDPKMVELAKYAKQHVPEQHPKVSPPHNYSFPSLSLCASPLGSPNSVLPSPGQTKLRAGPCEEAAGSRCGVGADVHGENRQPRPHQRLPRAARQVGWHSGPGSGSWWRAPALNPLSTGSSWLWWRTWTTEALW